jgi:hypothetical protein
VKTAPPAALTADADAQAGALLDKVGASESSVTAARREAKRDASAVTASPRAQEPEAWLKRIDALRAAGKNALADDQLRRFRRAFPNYLVKPATTSPADPAK